MRTCVAIGAKLHLIEPLGFKLNDKTLKRSHLDYVEHLDYEIYHDYDVFEKQNPGAYFYLTRYGMKNYADFDYQNVEAKDIYLIFGKESTGIDKAILAKHLDRCFRIPTSEHVRSLNLSNAVAIVSYEVLRQLDYPQLSKFEPESQKGKDFLLQFVGEKDED